MTAPGERIEQLLQELHTEAPQPVAGRVDELVQSIVDLYGAGLSRIMAALAETGASTPALERRLVEDPLVSSLLVLHRLHPLPLRERIEAALDAARPALAAHAGDVALVGTEEGVARIRLEGRCGSCSSTTATVEGLLERAIHEAAPEIERVEVVEAASSGSGQLVQLGRSARRAP